LITQSLTTPFLAYNLLLPSQLLHSIHFTSKIFIMHLRNIIILCKCVIFKY
jgi:hypothetical protein